MTAADYYDVEPEPRDREAEAAAWEDEAERRWEQARDDAVPEPAEIEQRLLGYALGRLGAVEHPAGPRLSDEEIDAVVDAFRRRLGVEDATAPPVVASPGPRHTAPYRARRARYAVGTVIGWSVIAGICALGWWAVYLMAATIARGVTG